MTGKPEIRCRSAISELASCPPARIIFQQSRPAPPPPACRDGPPPRPPIRPCFEVMAALTAPLGVFGVLGNHDYWHGVTETRAAMAAAGVVELTNAGVWVRRGSDRFRLAGVDDLWTGNANAIDALGDA